MIKTPSLSISCLHCHVYNDYLITSKRWKSLSENALQPGPLLFTRLPNDIAFYGNAGPSFVILEIVFHHHYVCFFFQNNKFPPKDFANGEAAKNEFEVEQTQFLRMFHEAKKDIYVNMTRRFWIITRIYIIWPYIKGKHGWPPTGTTPIKLSLTYHIAAASVMGSPVPRTKEKLFLIRFCGNTFCEVGHQHWRPANVYTWFSETHPFCMSFVKIVYAFARNN